ncbi:probable serine/threonine-protein kinase samkC isoform X2 [Xiphophorus hellerii]|uniref:probable serine/threonine-protein kinase samkC isoform X2 n=1 Tax=Xiphophorus hellerii TaxID=8084 RepID=UPI0013B42A5D|nr:probable serine/threonine-protein kinase samkC isoform X2 [Xiphophorus hellerii]
MGGRECCVISCGSSSHDHQGRMFLNGLSFHCFPAWRTKEGDFISELTRRRRDAWVTAVGRREITFDRIPSSMRVCSRHFLSGKPAYEMLDSDPDWVPSLHLGHDGDDEYEEKSWNKRRRLSSDEKPVEGADGAAEARKPPPPAWKDVKSALQSLLEGKTIISQQQGDDQQNQGAETRTDSSFRDFFRNALESSLEASIQARARSKSRSPSTEYEVELNVKLPSSPGEPSALEEPSSSQPSSSQPSSSQPSSSQPSSSQPSFSQPSFLQPSFSQPSSSPSCANCSTMLQRIRELEQKLFEVASRHKFKVLNRPKQTITEETRPSGEEATAHVGPVQATPSTSRPPRPPQRRRHCFRKEWVKIFPFLRYSPSLNIMWCHVCRVHADSFCQNHRLIKGSNHFTKSSIRKHTNSAYHQQNMQRFLWSSHTPLEEPSGPSGPSDPPAEPQS